MKMIAGAIVVLAAAILGAASVLGVPLGHGQGDAAATAGSSP